MKITRRAVTVIALAVASTFLAGCTQSSPFPNVTDVPIGTHDTVSNGLNGRIHGGQQPIVGARIYLLAAGTSGYGSAATSLLTSTSYAGYPTQQDANGRYYVTTDSVGNFQIADTCTPGQQVYVASLSGNPGGGTNTAAGEIAILGQCPAAGNFDSTLSGVFISEISTIAAAYAVSAYAVDPFDIGGPSSTALETTGIANAFANAANLFDVTNINDQARTSTLYGNGTVQQAKIHALANIIAACVNSTGPSSSSCTTLFSNAKSAGSSGTIPAGTATAAINIAHNPSANVATLFNLASSTSPFATTLTSAPNDFTLRLRYDSTALGSNPSMAVDASGNVWLGAPGTAAVTELSPLGKLLSGSAGYSTAAYVTNIRAIAVIPGGNLGVLGTATSAGVPIATSVELTSAGAILYGYTESTTFPTYPPTSSTNVAVDSTGNLYYAAVKTTSASTSSSTCCTVKYTFSPKSYTELDTGSAAPGTNFLAMYGSTEWITSKTANVERVSGGTTTVVNQGGLDNATGVAMDNAGNAWIVNNRGNSLTEYNAAGTSGQVFFGGGLASPQAIAVDGLGTVWLTNSSGSYGLSQFTSAGAAVGTGYTSAGITNASGLVLDPSGNAWVADSSSATVLEYMGVAAPVVTPIAAAVAAGTLGTRP